MTTQSNEAAELPEALRPIQRYKIGYHADEWGMRSSTPSGIPDPAGAWVRYEDHAAVITALRTQQPAPAGATGCDTPNYCSSVQRCTAQDEARAQPAPATQQAGWTNADTDAARLALELECLLMDTKDTAVVSKWWQSANEALELHRARLQEVQPSPTPQAEQQAAPKAAPVREHDLQDVRCECCGYMTYHREHMGCIRATAPTSQPAPVAQVDARAEQALLKVLAAVQRYLPPDGPSAKDTLSEIIGIVDPWPLGDLKGKA